MLASCERSDERLNRRTAWRFALVTAACMFVALVIAGIAVQWLFRRHLDLGYLLGYAALFTVMVTSSATFTRQRRLRRATKTPPPP